MTAVVATSAVVPLMAEPSPRAELVSQLLMGETGSAVEEREAWLRVRRDLDGYGGWVHRGYVRVVGDDVAAEWRERADHRSDGAELVDENGWRVALPLLARVAIGGSGTWELASGGKARLISGVVLPAATMERQAAAARPIDWVTARFAGAPYLWGGVTPWGVDCSGLVQTTFAARGCRLPRDSSEQANEGTPVAAEAIQPGDLLFFSESGVKITHVAFAGDGETLVHSTLACGGFITESFLPGSRAARLKDQLVAIRRIGE
jgi:gamma-D-glutamyl-L-lysine dipeptidyl-peptidase